MIFTDDQIKQIKKEIKIIEAMMIFLIISLVFILIAGLISSLSFIDSETSFYYLSKDGKVESLNYDFCFSMQFPGYLFIQCNNNSSSPGMIVP